LAISCDRKGPGGAVKRRRLPVALAKDGGVMTKMATLACSTEDEHNHSMRVPPLSSTGHT
jgi:hypothetical protein